MLGGVEMSSVAVSISPDVLVWVLKKIATNQKVSEIAELIREWQSGEKTPTFKAIENVSQKTQIPFGYFFLKQPPEEECELIECRTIDSKTLENPSRELIDTVDMMSNVQEWMAEYNKDNEFNELNFVGSFSEKFDVMDLVDDICFKLEIKRDWFIECKDVGESFRYLREKISDLGILVMQNGVVGLNTNRKLNIEEFRAFTLINKYAPLIFINTNDTKNGKIFSLLHELTHIWLGNDNLYNDSHAGSNKVSKLEQLCNAVAAEILVPDKLFIKKWRNSEEISVEKIKSIAQYFKCSSFVIARRALNKKFISKQFYDEFIEEKKIEYDFYKKRRSDKGGGGNFYSTLISHWDRRFILALDSSTKMGRTQYLEAYRLVQMKGKTFHKFVDKLKNRVGGDIE